MTPYRRFIRRWKYTITAVVLIIATSTIFTVLTGKWYVTLLVIAYATAIVWRSYNNPRKKL